MLCRTTASVSTGIPRNCSDSWTVSPTAGWRHITAEAPPRLRSKLNPWVTGWPGSPSRVRLNGNDSRKRGWRLANSYGGLCVTTSEVFMLHSGAWITNRVGAGRCPYALQSTTATLRAVPAANADWRGSSPAIRCYPPAFERRRRLPHPGCGLRWFADRARSAQ